MIFVDTSIWYAANVAEDPEHDDARRLLLGATSELVTTDYVIDELLTLLVARKHREVAVRIGPDFWAQKSCSSFGLLGMCLSPSTTRRGVSPTA
jgi:predicted nucleic acid-binding protein